MSHLIIDYGGFWTSKEIHILFPVFCFNEKVSFSAIFSLKLNKKPEIRYKVWWNSSRSKTVWKLDTALKSKVLKKVNLIANLNSLIILTIGSDTRSFWSWTNNTFIDSSRCSRWHRPKKRLIKFVLQGFWISSISAIGEPRPNWLGITKNIHRDLLIDGSVNTIFVHSSY